MKEIKFIILVLSVTVFLGSCSSSKKTASTYKPEKKTVKSKKKEKEVVAKSDEIFNDFNKKYGSGLNSTTLVYIDTYKNIAIEDMEKFKIPASITLAQGILESGSGKSTLALKSNNHFGIKCHKNWNGKKVRHDDDRKRECFRKYRHPEESFDDHSKFLTTRGRYSSLFDLREDNYKAWAKGLKKAGYATDRKYPQKLITIIEDYHLSDYDRLVLKGNKKYSKEKQKFNKDEEIVIANSFVVVDKGDTLYSIARKNSITVSNLKSINGLTSNEINIGQKLYLTK